jgi:tight adherence protein B
MAIAMSGGGSIDRSRALVRAAAEQYDIASPDADDPVDRVLDLSMRAGVPAAELLRSEAEQLRRDARSAGQRRAATLSVTLMLPLGLCVLPAFMLVGVVPLLISVLSSTLTTF